MEAVVVAKAAQCKVLVVPTPAQRVELIRLAERGLMQWTKLGLVEAADTARVVDAQVMAVQESSL